MLRPTVSFLINGKTHLVSDCQHMRLDATGTSCAMGHDMNVNPCATCDAYAQRSDDPFGGKREPPKALLSARLEFGSQPAAKTTDPPQQGVVAKATSWLKAEASAIFAKLPDEQYEARIAACRACPQLDPLPDPQVGYCKACGCGKRSRAELTVKGRMPAATCPLKKWGG